MEYYFPTFLTSPHVNVAINPELKFTTNTGKNALRLLLRTFNLPPLSTIAIPAYVCPAVSEAVTEEGFTPLLLDLKSDNSYWTNYSLQSLNGQKIKALILVHLYGFLHPDTTEITDYCKQNNIHIIHDAAQSYGIDEKALMGNYIVYSFGPGKSSTAAGGGWIKNISSDIYPKYISPSNSGYVQNEKSKLFLKSRVLGYQFTLTDKLKQSLFGLFKEKKEISKMSAYQLAAASKLVADISQAQVIRKKNYQILSDCVKDLSNAYIPYDDTKGQYFKFILGLKNNKKEFADYLTNNKVPFFQLFSKPSTNNNLPHFLQNAASFFEFSCEASIPEQEIQRVANILQNFR